MCVKTKMQIGIHFFDRPLFLTKYPYSILDINSTDFKIKLIEFCLNIFGISSLQINNLQTTICEFPINKLDICIVHITGRLLGGKGGFGSQLRAQGGRMSKKKSTNIDSCRNLQGRRIRDVNQETKLIEFMKKAPELKRKAEEDLQKKINDALNPEPKKKYFTDVSYIEQSRSIQEGIEQAFQIDDLHVLKREQARIIPASYNDDPFLKELLSSEQDEEVSK